MLFCEEIEKKPKLREEYHTHLKRIKKWYAISIKRYSALLTSELMIEAMEKDVSSFNGVDDIFDLNYHFSTTTSFFSVSDGLVKLILSKYGIGPSEDFYNRYGIDYRDKKIREIKNPSWINDTTEVSGMAEILARVLRVEGVPFSFDLKSLMVERKARSTLFPKCIPRRQGHRPGALPGENRPRRRRRRA